MQAVLLCVTGDQEEAELGATYHVDRHRPDLLDRFNQSSTITSFSFGLMRCKEWDLQTMYPEQLQQEYSRKHVLVADLQVSKADTYCGSADRLAFTQKDGPWVLGSSKLIRFFGVVFQEETWRWPVRSPTRKKNYGSEAAKVLEAFTDCPGIACGVRICLFESSENAAHQLI